MLKPTPSGSEIRKQFDPKFSALVEGLTSEVEPHEALPRRIARAFLRYAARMAAKMNLPEQVFMNEAHESFHIAQGEVKEEQEPVAQA